MDGTATAEVVTTIVGIVSLDVGRFAVEGLHVRIDEALCGHTAAEKHDDVWSGVADGMVLDRVSTTDVESETVTGRTTYVERVTIELASLEPLT